LGNDCELATYRYGTNTTFNGTALDLIVEVTGEDNEYNEVGEDCVGLFAGPSSDLMSVRLNDEDAGDDVAYMDFRVTVVAQGTTTPVEVDRIVVTAFDLDIATGQTGTDDVYFRFPDSSYRSRDSFVEYDTGSYFGGLFQVKFTGWDADNCTDAAGSAVPACRASSVFITGPGSVLNTVSTVSFRVQNDNAYGQDNRAFAYRRMELSFEVSDLETVVTSNTDFGDAPVSYGDAGNSISANVAMGYGIVPDDDDIATINKSSPNSDGDDNDAEIYEFDDEDAVFLNGQPLDNQFLASDSTVNMDVTTFGTGFLSAWMDINVNGVFDVGEQVVTDLPIISDTVQTTSVPITIPAIATGGDSVVRFRFSTAAGEAATGFSANDGEVEDYKITLTSNVADVRLVKRITAVNGQPINPNDGTPLNVFVDDTTSPQAADDNDPGWPAGYLLGEVDAGLVKPGDELEYTVYFLNAGNLLADDVRICDRLYPEQSLENDGYGLGVVAQAQIGTGAVVDLTALSDSVDRTEFIGAGGSVPATCNLQGVNDNGTLVVDVTGPPGSGSPALTQLEATTGAGVPNDSYGLFRFRTRVTP
ncbi:MAG: GEVED domain-containing protein, partial [Cyanobacteria bacterium J06598_3]